MKRRISYQFYLKSKQIVSHVATILHKTLARYFSFCMDFPMNMTTPSKSVDNLKVRLTNYSEIGCGKQSVVRSYVVI